MAVSPIFRAGKACRRQPSGELHRRIQHAKAAASFALFRPAGGRDSTPKAPMLLLRDASVKQLHPYFHFATYR